MSIKLKEGTTEDIRLDRIEKFDERSKQFPITDILTAKKPRSYTWRCRAWLDQKNEGSCVGHGIAHELAARPAEVQGLTHKYAKEQIYWEAQKIDRWPGGSYPGASPVYEGSSVLAGVKIAHKLGWMESYRWGFGLEDLMLGVGYNGPAVLGVPWYKGMYSPNSEGYIKVTGDRLGGHCILCNAVNIKKERFTLHNSWGKGWGMDSECYISFEDMGKLLKSRGESAFFVKRHKIARKVT